MKLSVLGSGPGGYVAAIKAAQMGMQVTVVEEYEVGGTCLNWGCIPTKSLVASSEVLSRARSLEEYGVDLKGEILPNLAKINERKNRIVSTQVKGIRNLFKSWGIQLKSGRGVLTSPSEIRVTTKDGSPENLHSDKIIIATGSRPYQIPGYPFDGTRVLSSDHAVQLNDIPKSIIIIGAGVIGCEFASIYRELGSEVTVIDMLDRPLSTEDPEISKLLEKEFRKKKITLSTKVKAEKITIHDNSVHILLSDQKEYVADKVLITVGRAFNSEGIGLEDIGIQKGQCGEIIVNENLETNVPGVYAIGDVIGGLMLAHVASREGIIAVMNASGSHTKIDYSVVPSTIFTSPEIASVGIRQHQAEEKGIKFRTGHFQFRALAKAHTIGEIDGLVKVIAEEGSDKILGAHIIGPHASDLIHEAALAIRLGLTVKDIAETIHSHPTLSEALKEAADDVHGSAIHIPPKR
jgi:dihydrolipoamide dehydrogenase